MLQTCYGNIKYKEFSIENTETSNRRNNAMKK